MGDGLQGVVGFIVRADMHQPSEASFQLVAFLLVVNVSRENSREEAGEPLPEEVLLPNEKVDDHVRKLLVMMLPV